MPPPRPASSRSRISTPVTTKARATSTSTRSAGGRWSAACAAFSGRCCRAPTCGSRRRLSRRAYRIPMDAAPSRCDGGMMARYASRRVAATSSWRPGSIGSPHLPVAVGRRTGGATPAARHSGRASTGRAIGMENTARPSSAARHLQGHRREDPQRDLSLGVRAHRHGACNIMLLRRGGRSPWRRRSSACSPAPILLARARQHPGSTCSHSSARSLRLSRCMAFPAFTASVCNVQPTSRGHLYRLKSAGPCRGTGHQGASQLSRVTDEDRRVAADSAARGTPQRGCSRRCGGSSRRNICRARRSAMTT